MASGALLQLRRDLSSLRYGIVEGDSRGADCSSGRRVTACRGGGFRDGTGGNRDTGRRDRASEGIGTAGAYSRAKEQHKTEAHSKAHSHTGTGQACP